MLCNLASTNPSALSRRIADIYLASSLSAVSSPAVTARSPQPGREQLEKWAGLYVSPEAGDRVMRVRFRDGELQSALEADGRVFGVEATGDTLRYVREPQTELVFSGGENGAPATLTTYTDGKLQQSYSRVPPLSRPPQSCRNMPASTAATRSTCRVKSPFAMASL